MNTTDNTTQFSVLTILLLRPDALQCWIDNAKKIEKSLTYKNNEIVYFSKKVSSEGGKFAKEARAREEAITELLKPHHTHVFWIDTDVVEYPNDIIEQLMELDSENCISPYVFIEDNQWWPFKRFYDISCFVTKEGKDFNYFPPYTDKDHLEKQEVKSIGTCMLINAEVYRSGCKYDPFDERNEHIPFFEQALKNNFKVIAAPKIEVRHAFLPKYGVNFR
jgi:hypothetical protein